MSIRTPSASILSDSPLSGVADATAIVLAGGRSSRFGAEKLAALVDGEPLLHHAIRAAASVCAEVIVVGTPDGLPVTLPQDLATTPLVVLDDDRYEGPLAALASAAPSATRERLLVLGGDMPDLQAAIMRRLLTWSRGRTGACLIVDGWAQPLPMGLDRASVTVRSRELVQAGERSLRRLMASLDIEQVPELEWRALDPAALSLRDIDLPEDLTRLAD